LIWLAGTLKGLGQGSKKISKQQVMDSDILELSKKVTVPNEEMTLRVSATLLLGVVVIYQKKTNYVVSDASHAMERVKMISMYSTKSKDLDPAIDLPPVSRTAARLNAITLPAQDDECIRIAIETDILLNDSNFTNQWVS
jgi:hypothetical protein